jgi:hypothetical protein
VALSLNLPRLDINTSFRSKPVNIGSQSLLRLETLQQIVNCDACAFIVTILNFGELRQLDDDFAHL